VSCNPVHSEVYSIQHYVIKLVIDLRQVGGLLQVLLFPPPIKLTTMINTAEILLKMALNTINQTLAKTQLFRGVVFNSGETSSNLLCPLDLSVIETMTPCVGTLWSAEVLLSFVHAIIEIKMFLFYKKTLYREWMWSGGLGRWT
jgi:hypothetical protein